MQIADQLDVQKEAEYPFQLPRSKRLLSIQVPVCDTLIQTP